MIKKKLDFMTDRNGCFIVISHALNKDGYCYMWHDKKMRRAHRHVYEECFGKIEDGIVVRHKCDTRNCVNPEHLELGTNKENIRDCVDRGRNAVGVKNGSCTITEDTARKIKIMAMDGISSKKIASELNVGIKVARAIKEGNTWKHISIYESPSHGVTEAEAFGNDCPNNSCS